MRKSTTLTGVPLTERSDLGISSFPTLNDSVKQEFQDETGVISMSSYRIKTLDELLEAAKPDLSSWKVVSHKVTSQESCKTVKGEVTVVPLYKVEAKLERYADLTGIAAINPVHITVKHYAGPRDNYDLDTSRYRKALIIPDSQNGYVRDLRTGVLTPFHDRRCWDIAFQIAEIEQPDDIVFLGDMLDLCDWSEKYVSGPEAKATTEAAIHELAWCMANLRAICPDADINYIPGNHELRMDKLLERHAPSIIGIKPYTNGETEPRYPHVSIPALMGLEKLRINYLDNYPEGSLWLGEGCEIIHGGKVKSNGGDTAKAYLRDCDRNIIYGHIHRFELAYRTTHIRDEVVTRFAASPGTFSLLGGLTPSVHRRSDWQNGLMLSTYDPDSTDFDPGMIPINDGVCLYKGEKLYGDFPLEELIEDLGFNYGE